MNLKPLHNLYQTVSPCSHLETDHPLIAVSQLERVGSFPSGSIEWVVGLAAKAETGGEIWWSTRIASKAVEKLCETKTQGIESRDVPDLIRKAWLEGRLDIQGLEHGHAPIRLVVCVARDTPISIELKPTTHAPLSLLGVLVQVIPPFLACAESQTTMLALKPQLATVTSERDRLASDNALLRQEVKELNKKLRVAEATDATRGKRVRSEEPSQNSSQRGGASPQKKGRPGIDYKATMRPGQKGYAGSANRAGRNLEDEWEDPESD
ncbi:uncharacterized protein JCM15063_001871 [Sporobolomyces koalae]|uniref:uncharacterized protein n=1 Tax=Sporobolomyces koalae TaxID=500713 RepID=UPI0031783E02